MIKSTLSELRTAKYTTFVRFAYGFNLPTPLDHIRWHISQQRLMHHSPNRHHEHVEVIPLLASTEKPSKRATLKFLNVMTVHGKPCSWMYLIAPGDTTDMAR